MKWFHLVCLLLISSTLAESTRQKRQLSLDDIINRALSLVRPIFDTSRPLPSDDVMFKTLDSTQDDIRNSNVLGARKQSVLDDLPLCQGNSNICQFISCSAQNFKKDPSFGNLQLGVQVLSDPKLRSAISSNPEAITMVCKEQGMDEPQCKLFSNGFQLIDSFITTIEKPEAKGGHPAPVASPESEEVQQPQDDDPLPVPIQKDNQPQNDWDYESHPPSPSSTQNNKAMGSKTWGTQVEQGPLLLEDRNDLVASLTPPPAWVLPPLPVLPALTPPPPPTAPPLAFPTVPSFILQPFKNLEKFFSADKYPLGDPVKVETNSITRFSRSIDVDFEDDDDVRVKREDYYDALNKPKEEEPKQEEEAIRPVKSNEEDYYGQIDEFPTTKAPEKESPLKNCVGLLGLGQ